MLSKQQHIIGIGIDLLDLRRLEKLWNKSKSTRIRFTSRILTARESSSNKWKDLRSDSQILQFLANRSVDLLSSTTPTTLKQYTKTNQQTLRYHAWNHRWTAKEAAFKALYPLYRPTWKELNVLKNQPINHSLNYLSNPSCLLPELYHSLLSDKKPTMSFEPKYPLRIPLPHLDLSISHDTHHVVAIVIARLVPSSSWVRVYEIIFEACWSFMTTMKIWNL